MGGGGGGKSGGSIPSAATPVAAEAPKPYQRELELEESTQSARDEQNRRRLAALGQEGTILTSPFGSQEATQANAAANGDDILGA